VVQSTQAVRDILIPRVRPLNSGRWSVETINLFRDGAARLNTRWQTTRSTHPGFTGFLNISGRENHPKINRKTTERMIAPMLQRGNAAWTLQRPVHSKPEINPKRPSLSKISWSFGPMLHFY
jgi:hypothetical protein